MDTRSQLASIGAVVSITFMLVLACLLRPESATAIAAVGTPSIAVIGTMWHVVRKDAADKSDDAAGDAKP